MQVTRNGGAIILSRNKKYKADRAIVQVRSYSPNETVIRRLDIG